MNKNDIEVLCERCRNEPARSFSYIPLHQIKFPEEFLLNKSLTGEALMKAIDAMGEQEEKFDREPISLIPGKGCWIMAGNCTTREETYYVPFERYFKDVEAITDWLAHLSEKDWFDANDFCRMLYRFRKAMKWYFKT